MTIATRHIAAAALALLCAAGLHAQTDTTFMLPASGHDLAVRLTMPAVAGHKKCPAVVLCHGFGGSMQGRLWDGLAETLLRQGVAVLRFDFMGHGKSGGRFRDMTVPKEIDDAKAVVAYAEQLPQVGRVSLIGHSQGGVVAAMTAGQLGTKRIHTLCLLAPAAVLRDDALRGNTFGKLYNAADPPECVDLGGGRLLGREFVKTAQTLPIYETAARYRGRTLVVHGAADRVVPYTYGQRFAIEMPKAVCRLIEGEDHGFGQHLEETLELVAAWKW